MSDTPAPVQPSHEQINSKWEAVVACFLGSFTRSLDFLSREGVRGLLLLGGVLVGLGVFCLVGFGCYLLLTVLSNMAVVASQSKDHIVKVESDLAIQDVERKATSQQAMMMMAPVPGLHKKEAEDIAHVADATERTAKLIESVVSEIRSIHDSQLILNEKIERTASVPAAPPAVPLP